MATKTTEKKVEKIESLTPAQIELLDVWREKWIKIGLNCDPIDFPKAKEAAALAYELADLKAPKMYFVMRDPIEGAIAGTLLKELMEPGAGNEIASTLLIEAIWSACGKPKAYKSVSDIMDKDFSKRARAYLFAGRFGCSKGKGTVRWF